MASPFVPPEAEPAPAQVSNPFVLLHPYAESSTMAHRVSHRGDPRGSTATNPPKTKKKKKTHQKHIPTAVVMDGWTYPAEGGGFINRDYSQDRCRNCNQGMRVPLEGGMVHYVCPRCGFENQGKPRPISGQCCPFPR
eukprot:CAMPEP_0117030768 /NCGR_PEP_ID=MMETSP0472-20121206/22185_1 /TAXON_ID=693140 ORGANISM="Tiarina fusus, Strain LIS" /NCGR_SAMPLE_ID=MMETSP0472 /ASSEMBLY_ACC=CAM_ASM_000603 /LENGTH=136 /DNA_ID=CAMNT_0004738941 /DNA_START=28 /DNA_END=439 /DNA_ORIENTATION=+